MREGYKTRRCRRPPRWMQLGVLNGVGYYPILSKDDCCWGGLVGMVASQLFGNPADLYVFLCSLKSP